MTDAQIEAAAEAAWRKAYQCRWPNGWSEVTDDNREHWRKIARAALEAAEAALPRGAGGKPA